MTKNELTNMDLFLYEEELDNGLKVYLLPMENVTNYKIKYSTKYGSIDTKYYKHNKVINTPSGVAHFLEHKMFEQESGEDVHSHFSANSSYVNASTSNFITTYLCEGNKNFSDDLDYLISFVNAPYFTEENIEKEQGIIAEEIKMRLDNYFVKLIEESKKNIFSYSGYKDRVAGTIDSIKKITPKILYDCYNTFYVPNNMRIIITGKFDKDEAMKIIHKRMDSIKKSEDVKRFEVEEQDEVVKKKSVIKANVEIDKLIYTIKLNKKKLPKMPEEKKDMYLSLFLDTLLSPTSDFYERNFENNTFKAFETYNQEYANFALLNIIADTDKTDDLIKEIEEAIKNIPDKKTFERKKKVYIADTIAGSTSEFYMSGLIDGHLIGYDKVLYNMIDIIKSLKYDEFLSVIKKIDLDNKNICILKKNI